MPRPFALLLVAAVSLALAVPADPATAVSAGADPAATSAGSDRHRDTEEIVVGVPPGTAGSQAVGELGSDVPVVGRRVVASLDVEILEVPAEAADEALARLEAMGSVAYAEPAYPMETFQREPNDPWWSSQWGPRHVGAATAWATTTGRSDLVVAVLDTGVNAHPDLSGRLLAGRNFVTGQDPGDTTDREGHGTAVAGVIAARGDNGIGMAGMCWSCRVLPVKVLDDDGRGTTPAIAEGIVWAADRGADVINLSFGGATGGQAMGEAVAYAAQRGAVVVGAAGNLGHSDRMYPAAYQPVIGVAASRHDDSRYDWSNFGSWVDVAAPGCNVVTTAGGGYGQSCGTSFAAPVVSGTAALGLAADPDATAVDVRTAVQTTAIPVEFVRHGRVRADAAVHDLLPGVEPDPVPPSQSEPDPEPGPDPEPLPDVEPGGACPPGVVPPSGLTDLGEGVHRPSIECVVWYDIAQGFPDGTYRPGQAIRRDQLATFLVGQLRAAGMELPEPAPTGFTDIAGNVHERSIRQLAELGVVHGRTATGYEPRSPVTRAQMASFLWRGHRVVTGDELPADQRHFDDTAGSVHRDTVDALASAGIVDGRGERVYAPEAAVRRGPMASFLVKHLDVLAEQGRVDHP